MNLKIIGFICDWFVHYIELIVILFCVIVPYFNKDSQFLYFYLSYIIKSSFFFCLILAVKQCSEKFLAVLFDGLQEDLALGYLCHSVSKFVSSDNFKVYVDCCANHIHIDKTLHLLK